MHISGINQNYQTTFGVKFFDTPDLKSVADWAKAKDEKMIAKLYKSAKKIEGSYLTTRLTFEFGTGKNGFPCIIFTRYLPKKNVLIARTGADYAPRKQIIYEAREDVDKFEFAYEKLVRMGNNAPNNRIFQKIVVNK